MRYTLIYGIYINIYLKSHHPKNNVHGSILENRCVEPLAGTSLQPGHRGREVRVPSIFIQLGTSWGNTHILITFLLHYITGVLIFSCKRYCVVNDIA